MEKKLLPPEVLRDLKCNLCGEFLSYPPIILHAETGSVCGRCPDLEAENNIQPLREINYEKIVQKLCLFPCRYHLQGCQGEFSILEIPEHEKVCNLKPFFCPKMPLGSCAWQGTPDEAHFHFINDHQDFMLQSNIFELDVISNYAVNELLCHCDVLFLVHKKMTEDDIFYCTIYQINNRQKKFDYYLEFKSGDGQKKLQVGEKKVPLYNDDISKEHGFKINVPIIQETLNTPTMITCTLDISEAPLEVLENMAGALKLERKDEIHDLTKDDENDGPKVKVEDDKMLLDLECPVCQEFMVPPIYQCHTGHSVCGTCKPQLRECPFCRGQLGDIRNFTLEKLTEHIMYQCKNRLDGCDFRTNSKEIRNHEQTCNFSPVKCPLHEFKECDWKGLNKSIVSHMRNQHPDNLLSGNDRLIIKIQNIEAEEVSENYKVVNIYNEIFRLRICSNIDKNKFYATAQMIGTSEDAKKYLYEMKIIDLQRNVQSIQLKKFCGSINDKKSNAVHCSTLPLDLVEQLLKDDVTLEVHFKIFKI